MPLRNPGHRSASATSRGCLGGTIPVRVWFRRFQRFEILEMTKTIDFKPGEPSFALETLHVMSEHEKNVAVDTGDDVLYMNFILSEVSGFRRFQNSGFLKTSKTRNQNPIRQRDLQESPDTMSVHHTSKDEVPRCSGWLGRLDFVRFLLPLRNQCPRPSGVACQLM